MFVAEGLDGSAIRDAWRPGRAQATPAPAAVAAEPAIRADRTGACPRRASIAVMPFADRSAAARERGGVAHALAHDVTMFGARAMALTRLGRFEEAGSWAVKAAARPNAHVHIHAIAAYCSALAGSLDQARGYAAAVRKSVPRYGLADFLDAFRFDADGTARFRKAARRIGMT